MTHISPFELFSTLLSIVSWSCHQLVLSWLQQPTWYTAFYCQLVLSSTGLVMVTATHLVHCFLLSTGLVMVTVTHLVDVILVKKKHSTHLEYTAMLHGSFDLMWSLLFRCVSLPNLRFGHTCNTDRRGCSNHSAAEVEDHLQSLYSHELCN